MNTNKNNRIPQKPLINIRLSDKKDAVIILDQRLLPNTIKYLELRTIDEMYDAIYTLKVRGAPAIGVFAAYAFYICCQHIEVEDKKYKSDECNQIAEKLKSARPTAVNLAWAVDRMLAAHKSGKDLLCECQAIHNEDIAMCKAISEHGLTLLKDGDCVITHCNAGALATSQYGTGLGALILGAERGMKLRAYVDETRPLLQGARITALELMNAGVDTTLICDNMVSAVMQQKTLRQISAAFVGCDRVAANGDVANKIGTSGLAVLAKHYGVPFYVFCPASTFDKSCKTGADIVIEERNATEITELYFKERIAPKDIKCFNPSFDVTPAELITAIVTEKGIFAPNEV
ncbi:MAG: S-methyl-5-thioribose-1-phosphate isomerase [Oscillospiraceae bacterium]|nr:S-methyl-5-thioribose-1-phosphate isomerase [Oscillospiraceae bacterium]